MRLTLRVSPRFHISSNSFEKLKWLNISKLVDHLTVGSHMFNIYHGTTPSYLMNAFTSLRVSDSNNHYVGDRELNFVLPQVKSQEHRGFMFNWIQLWNNVPWDL